MTGPQALPTALPSRELHVAATGWMPGTAHIWRTRGHKDHHTFGACLWQRTGTEKYAHVGGKAASRHRGAPPRVTQRMLSRQRRRHLLSSTGGKLLASEQRRSGFKPLPLPWAGMWPQMTRSSDGPAHHTENSEQVGPMQQHLSFHPSGSVTLRPRPSGIHQEAPSTQGESCHCRYTTQPRGPVPPARHVARG